MVFIILWKVIPVFAQLFAGLGGEMPFLTRMVIGASNFVGRLLLPHRAWSIVAGCVAINRWHKTYHGRRILDGLLLKIPVIGMLLRKIAVARFCRTLATLTASGVPILDGLEITAKTAGNADHRGRRHGGAQERRGRQDDQRAARRDQGLPRPWSCR